MTLNDKRGEIEEYLISQIKDNLVVQVVMEMIEDQDKEFIKKLKDELYKESDTCTYWAENIIDKLAGDALIDNPTSECVSNGESLIGSTPSSGGKEPLKTSLTTYDNDGSDVCENCGHLKEHHLTKETSDIFDYGCIETEECQCKKFKPKDVCDDCGKPHYNHLNKNGVRSSVTGIYCDDSLTKKFKPKDVCEKGCGKQEVNYEEHNETGEPIPCELLTCGKGWLCDKCKPKEVEQ